MACEPWPLTSDRITSSEIEITTICNPVGRPMRITWVSILPSSRRDWSSIRSGASTLPLRRRRQTRKPSDAAWDTKPASAALWMPMGGSPSQPLIRAGVSTRPRPVDSNRASSGVTVSLTPRSSCV
ncbi:hypothetical protein D9M69_623140 [compost metagenome]